MKKPTTRLSKKEGKKILALHRQQTEDFVAKFALRNKQFECTECGAKFRGYEMQDTDGTNLSEVYHNEGDTCSECLTGTLTEVI